jgi:integrase
LSPEQKNQLIEAISQESDWVGLLVGLLAETGLRLYDALQLLWEEIDLDQGLLSKRTSKSGTDVRIPLSERAAEILREVPRIVGSAYVFTQPGTRRPRNEAGARGALNRARKKVGLEWVGFHDLRHFRATQWLMHGADVKTVKEMLGHTDIQTTMRYVHYVESHAIQSVIRAQKQEAAAAQVATAN